MAVPNLWKSPIDSIMQKAVIDVFEIGMEIQYSKFKLHK
jgi:hypothetical protein